jgi:hypothetical protein
MATDTVNPYAPVTAAEQDALASYMTRVPLSLRPAFEAGVAAKPEVTEELPAAALTKLWTAFVTADMELDRTYPRPADAFVAGYRAELIAS